MVQGKAWAEVPKGNAADVDAAVRAAKAAFEAPVWRDLTAHSGERFYAV